MLRNTTSSWGSLSRWFHWGLGLVIIGIGALVFAIGARRNLMAETKLAEQVLSNETQPGLVSPSYPRFNAIVYSLDVFLPFV